MAQTSDPYMLHECRAAYGNNHNYHNQHNQFNNGSQNIQCNCDTYYEYDGDNEWAEPSLYCVECRQAEGEGPEIHHVNGGIHPNPKLITHNCQNINSISADKSTLDDEELDIFGFEVEREAAFDNGDEVEVSLNSVHVVRCATSLTMDHQQVETENRNRNIYIYTHYFVVISYLHKYQDQ